MLSADRELQLLELLQEKDDLEIVIAPVGGGGLYERYFNLCKGYQ